MKFLTIEEASKLHEATKKFEGYFNVDSDGDVNNEVIITIAEKLNKIGAEFIIYTKPVSYEDDANISIAVSSNNLEDLHEAMESINFYNLYGASYKNGDKFYVVLFFEDLL